jgi:hypothetical protein
MSPAEAYNAAQQVISDCSLRGIKLDETTEWKGKYTPESKKIDWEQPLEGVGRSKGFFVRLLARGVNMPVLPGKGNLVSVNRAGGRDLLVLVDDLGQGRSIRHPSIQYTFRNVVVPQVRVLPPIFLNVYDNSATDGVIEIFDTRKQADDSNLFQSRDFCLRIDATKTDGVWTATSTIEAQ